MWLTYFLFYMGFGVVALATLSAYRTWWASQDHVPRLFVSEKTPSWKMRLFDAIFEPIAVLLIFVPLWPLILSVELGFPWNKFKFWTDKAARDVPWTLTNEEPAFVVSKADLLERFSRAEVEVNERVDDPLHAVPDQPFGHLHKVWQTFIDGLEPDSELWSFRGRWKTEYRDYQTQGYVARLGEKIGPYFLTLQRSMKES